MKRDDGEAAFVLVSALLALALLSAIALALSYQSRNALRTARNETGTAIARAAVDGIVRIITFRLPDRTFLPRFREMAPGNSTLSCRLDDSRVALEVLDAGGLIDLNAASTGLLEALLSGLGANAEQAQAHAIAIAAFRRPASPEEAEATAAAYAAAGLPYGPKLAPFESVLELDQVLGLGPDTVAAVRPFVTVHSRLPGLDTNAAPPGLLALLKAGERETATGLAQALQMRSPGRAFVIRARVSEPGGAAAFREAVVELSNETATGSVLREWSVGAASILGPASNTNRENPGNTDCRALF